MIIPYSLRPKTRLVIVEGSSQRAIAVFHAAEAAAAAENLEQLWPHIAGSDSKIKVKDSLSGGPVLKMSYPIAGPVAVLARCRALAAA